MIFDINLLYYYYFLFFLNFFSFLFVIKKLILKNLVTFHKLFNFYRKKIKKIKKISALQQNPQKKAICLKIYTLNPKKPNSADRKVAKVQLSNKKIIIGYIPGENHSLQQHSLVLVCGGCVKDLPGVNYKFIKRSYDFK